MSHEEIMSAITEFIGMFSQASFQALFNAALQRMLNADNIAPVFEPGAIFPVNQTRFFAAIDDGKRYCIMALPNISHEITGTNFYITLNTATLGGSDCANPTIIVLPLQLSFRRINKFRFFKPNLRYRQLTGVRLVPDAVFKLKVTDTDSLLDHPANMRLMKQLYPNDNIQSAEFSLSCSGVSFNGLDTRTYIVSRCFMGETLKARLRGIHQDADTQGLTSDVIFRLFSMAVPYTARVVVAHAFNCYLRDVKSGNALSGEHTGPIDLDSAAFIFVQPEQFAAGHNMFSRAPETGSSVDLTHIQERDKVLDVHPMGDLCPQQLTRCTSPESPLHAHEGQQDGLVEYLSGPEDSRQELPVGESQDIKGGEDCGQEGDEEQDAQVLRLRHELKAPDIGSWRSLKRKLKRDAGIELIDEKIANILLHAMRADVYSLAILYIEIFFGVDIVERMWERSYEESSSIKSQLQQENASIDSRRELAAIFRDMLYDDEINGFFYRVFFVEQGVIKPLLELLYGMLSPHEYDRPHVLRVFTELVNIASLLTICELDVENEGSWPWSFSNLVAMTSGIEPVDLAYKDKVVTAPCDLTFSAGVTYHGDVSPKGAYDQQLSSGF